MKYSVQKTNSKIKKISKKKGGRKQLKHMIMNSLFKIIQNCLIDRFKELVSDFFDFLLNYLIENLTSWLTFFEQEVWDK